MTADSIDDSSDVLGPLPEVPDEVWLRVLERALSAPPGDTVQLLPTEGGQPPEGTDAATLANADAPSHDHSPTDAEGIPGGESTWPTADDPDGTGAASGDGDVDAGF